MALPKSSQKKTPRKMRVSCPRMLKYTEEEIQAACAEVRMKKRSVNSVAKAFGVPECTLRDRLKGKTAFHEVERTVITKREEEKLVEWIKECTRKGCGRTIGHVSSAVQSILNKRKAVTKFKDNYPGYKWVTLFLRRHKDVSLVNSRAHEARRAAVTEAKMRAWLETAQHEIQAVGGDVLDHPSRIFSCGETGFQLGSDGGFSKVSASKGDTDTQITVLACGSASGEVHSPLIIFPGQSFFYNPLEGFPEAYFAKSSNGWIDGNIFTDWLKTAFIPATEHLPKPVVLFADGHKTLTLTVRELCKNQDIILYQLPSHFSHIVQPLNLSTFKRLKEVWGDEVLNFQEQKREPVGRKDFSGVLKKAWEHGITKDSLVSDFRLAGLYPWNPDPVDMTNLAPSQLYVTPSTKIETVRETVTETLPTTGPVPGASENDCDTNMPEDPLVDPPSPTTDPSPLPPLYPTPSPSTSTTTVSLPFTSTVLPSRVTSSSTTTVSLPSSSSLSSNIISPSRSHNIVASTSTSSFTPPNNMPGIPRQTALDRLLDLAIKAGHDKLTRYKTLLTLGLQTDDPEERLFCHLYTEMIRQDDNTVEQRTFGILPLPSQTLQPPRMVSSDAFRQYSSDMDSRRRKIEEKKEKKKERKEKKKRTEDDKKKKQERKKRAREEKKRAEKEIKVTQDSSKYVDSDLDLDGNIIK